MKNPDAGSYGDGLNILGDRYDTERVAVDAPAAPDAYLPDPLPHESDAADTAVLSTVKDSEPVGQPSPDNEYVPDLDLSTLHAVLNGPTSPLPTLRGKSPSLGSRIVEGARKAAEVTFGAPGYLSNLIDRKLGDAYAKVRYSGAVDSLVGNTINKATEHGVATPAIFAVGKLATKVLGGVAQHTFGHLPDIDLPSINMPDIDLPGFDNDKTNVEVPAEVQPAAPAEAGTDNTVDNPTPKTPTLEPSAKENEFEAESGDSSWKATKESLEAAAKHAGVDADKLTTDRNINQAMEAFTDQNGVRYLNEDETYYTGDLDQVAEAMANDLKEGGNDGDNGHLSHKEFKAALDDTPAIEQPSEPKTDDAPTSPLVVKPPTGISPSENHVMDSLIELPGKYAGEGVIALAGVGSFIGQRFVRNKQREGILRDAKSGEIRDLRSAKRLGIAPEALAIATANRPSLPPIVTQNRYKRPDDADAFDDDESATLLLR